MASRRTILAMSSGVFMFRVGLGCALALWASVANAADKLSFGPPAAWVKPVPIPTVALDPGDNAPARRLLADMQMNFAPTANEVYLDTALRIQTVQGLSAGIVGILWRPDIETVTVHSVHIVRGGQVIDVLRRGQTFTVLRRETNLERAMLDGVLTATLQPEGLRVGDVVEYSITKRQLDPIMQGYSELVAGQMPGPPIDRLRLRALWPTSKPIRWRQTFGLPTAVLTKTAEGSEVVIDAIRPERPKLPKGAPPRYGFVSNVEFSQFADWAQASAIMAPLYVKAATLAPDSPIKAEAAKIRAASSDPKVQAMAALRLVQDQVRYLYLGMDLGGYLPADAEVTWQRRFGDCKAKTTLLLALLQELGITAQPALVSTVAGDGMDERLPMVELFNHILIRATLDGKTYWLDGTRTGDRSFDALAVPNWRWALPVQASGAKLKRLEVPPLDIANVETRIRIDATAGLDTPAPTRIELTYRGDVATGLHQMLALVAPGDLDKTLRSGVGNGYRALEIGKVEQAYDDATNEQRVTIEGETSLAWAADTTGGRLYTPDSGRLSMTPDYKREPGYGIDAPYAVPHPVFAKISETILLPQSGKGFSLVGDPIDLTAGGIHLQRTGKLEGQTLSVESASKTIATEFPASESSSVRDQLLDLNDSTLSVRAPKGFKSGPAELALRLSRTPSTAGSFLDRGEAWFEKGETAKALADYEAGFKLKPTDARSLNGRCFALARAGQMLEAALADCNAALDIEPRMAGILDSRGFVHYRLGNLDKAITDFDRALKIDTDLAPSLYVRGLAKRAKGDRSGGEQDIKAARKLDPKVVKTYAAYGVK